MIREKKNLNVLLLVAMLVVSIGTTVIAAGPAGFYAYKSDNCYNYRLENMTKNYKYAKITINGYDKNWNYKCCIGSGATVLAGSGQGKNGLCVYAAKKYPCAKGIGAIYNGQSAGSGVAASYSKQLSK